MKRITATLGFLIACLLALASPAPARAQAMDTTVFCRACVKVDSAGVPDSAPAWRYFTTWAFTFRDSLEIRPKPVTPPAPAPAGNEPAGLVVLADTDWVGLAQQAGTAPGTRYGPWARRAGAARGFSVLDPTAPLSPRVLEIDFSGIRQGTGPESFTLDLPAGTRELYLRFPVYIPATYYGSTSGVQKLWHLWSTNDSKPTYLPGGSMMVPAIYGVGASGLSYQLRVQGASTTATQAISFNIACGALQRGRWYVLEAYVRQNTANADGTVNADGVAIGWVDGRQTCARSTLQYSGPAVRVKQWTATQLNPTYGGTGTAPAGVMLRYGRVRVSAR